MSRKKDSAYPEQRNQKADRSVSSGCIGPADQAARARTVGNLKPDLAYTCQQAVPGPDGWVESNATVRSKQKSKEEFPRG